MCEVMTNLLTNAIKYRSDSGLRMAIDIGEEEEAYVVSVRDWGIGVRRGLEDKIFREGFRAPEAIGRVQGTGFGLAISRQIMRQMGGDLRLSRNSNPTE